MSDINLDIFKNETIAIVGESGSGKTTLLNCITGLYEISAGELEIDGIPINKLSIKSYRNALGYITQDPAIFGDSLINNITSWESKNEVNMSKLRKSLKGVALSNFLNDLSCGDEFLLESGGANISGGQKQRIAIARELYKNPDILCLDEATASLDSETEKVIGQTISEYKGSRTVIIVAHRFTTIKNADRIVLMKEGEIRAIGTFDSLFANEPIFRKMAQSQSI